MGLLVKIFSLLSEGDAGGPIWVQGRETLLCGGGVGKGIYFGKKTLFMPPPFEILIYALFSRCFFATFSRSVFQ